MNLKRNIEAFAEIDGRRVPCKGIIEIRKIDRAHYTAYATWQFFDADGLVLAGKSTNYFMGKRPFTQEELISRILENIKRYRIGRNHVFDEVKLI